MKLGVVRVAATAVGGIALDIGALCGRGITKLIVVREVVGGAIADIARLRKRAVAISIFSVRHVGCANVACGRTDLFAADPSFARDIAIRLSGFACADGLQLFALDDVVERAVGVRIRRVFG